jgi:hypothetical protein
MRQWATRLTKWTLLTVLVVYAVLALGLFAFNRIYPAGTVEDNFLEATSSGAIRLLASGKDSFSARLNLINQAKRSLDL